MHVMTHVMIEDAPGLPSALAAVAEAWVRLPAGAVKRLVELEA